MNTPVYLLTAAVLIWGWQAGQWTVALAVSLALEGARYFRHRSFSAQDFNRVADLCTVLALAAGVVLYFIYGNPRAIKLWFQWLPLMVLPLTAMQAWSASPAIDLSVLFWSLRRRPLRRPIRINLGYPYLGLWLLAASAANTRSPGFYPALVAATAWALWPLRPRGRSAALWAGAIVIAACAGYAGQTGLSSLQQWLEANVPEWLAAGGTRTNPYESRTDLGRLGELKLSGKILLRVSAPQMLQAPLLLHRASYDDYVGTAWVARSTAFFPVFPSSAGTWDLAPRTEDGRRVRIDDESGRDNPVLSLPAGATRIEGLDALQMQRNPLGTVQIEIAPGRFRYEVEYRRASADEAPPAPIDLRVSRFEEAAVRKTAAELGLAGLPATAALTRIERYFSEGYRYASFQGTQPRDMTPLAYFLTRSHAGHCEYFATATVMLARAANLPARYATGLSVQEFSDLEHVYVVRQRHAHAWARVFVDGAWRDFDTTPPDWFRIEADQQSAWSFAADLWSWLGFRASRAASTLNRDSMVGFVVAIALLVAAWLAWRLWRGSQAAPAVARRDPIRRNRAGSNSEFYLFENRLSARGIPRGKSEALSEWLERAAKVPIAFDLAAARAALRLHYRYRFDPRGLSNEEREQLAGLSRRLAAELGDSRSGNA